MYVLICDVLIATRMKLRTMMRMQKKLVRQMSSYNDYVVYLVGRPVIEELTAVKLTTFPGGRHIGSKECAYSCDK